MRTDLGRIGLVAAWLVAAFTACNNDHFEEVTWEFSTVLPSHVLQFFDNGCLSDPAMSPLVNSHDGFYLVSSNEMIDSLFYGDHSALDSLLPEGGSLLVLCTWTCIEDELLGYSYEVSGDSVTIWVEFNEWHGSDPDIPAVDTYLLPFGVVLQPAAEPEP